ncbi:hypothetical protein [Solirubrobacter soli]|uniref:hypothetical protein n=1 Tax=Solirubrobacter soli TaxID=363832 RepID=UPI00040B0780|nr:hypothetical protein [Solirubrobacter soli]
MTTRTKLKREEDVEREDGRREAAPPPAPVSQMLDLQRTMGNQAAMALMARSVRATLAREPGTAEAPQANASISQAIADRDIGAIKAIDDFTPASDPQRFELIAILLDQFWVGPRDEAALERIWASFGERLPAMMATHARVWWDCRDRGAELPRWTRWDNLNLTCEISPGVINDRQVRRAVARIDEIPENEYLQFRQLMYFSGSGVEMAYLCKALAAERSIADIATFASAIRGKDRAWLLANLNVADENVAQGGSAAGIQQQWQMACGPTSVQTIRAQNDPIYALSLTAAGPVSGASWANLPMTLEQGAILIGHGSMPTPLGTAGQGAWVESDLNSISSTTGVTYAFTAVNALAPVNPAGGEVDKAVDSIIAFLNQGIQVPILIGGGPNVTAHYVMGLRAQGDQILINDPGSGTTTWVGRQAFLTNTLAPPLSWPFLAGYDKPTPKT